MKAKLQPSPPGRGWAPVGQHGLQNRTSVHYREFRRVFSASEAPPWARGASPNELQAAAAAAQQTGIEHLSIPSEVSESSNGSNGRLEPANSASNATNMPKLCSPEDLVLEPGECSQINRSSPLHPADVYRCSGCLEEACQVSRAHSLRIAYCMTKNSHAGAFDERCARASKSLGCGYLQGPSGCAKMLWRNQPGGYLKEILTARVYDVAVSCHMGPTHFAKSRPLTGCS